MIDVEKVVPLNNETGLLGGGDGTTSKGGIDVESSCLGIRRCINDEGPDIIEGSPITCEKVCVDAVVDRGNQGVAPGEGKVLYDSKLEGRTRFRNST